MPAPCLTARVPTIPGFEYIAIAATAAAHGFTVLTANERHFAPLGVTVVNPFKRLPPPPA